MSLTARNVFLSLTVVYAVLQVLQWTGVLTIDQENTPGWAIGLLAVFVAAWLGSGLIAAVVALRRSRAKTEAR